VRFNVILLLGVLCPGILPGQNHSPVISHIEVKLDTPRNRVFVTYDAYDADGDQLEVQILIRSQQDDLPIDKIVGDVGYPIKAGKRRKVSLYYPGSVSTKFKTGNYKLQIIAGDRKSPDIRELIRLLQVSKIKHSVEKIYGIRHYKSDSVHLEEVRQRLFREFRESGLFVTRQPFEFIAGHDFYRLSGPSGKPPAGVTTQQYRGANIIGEIPGMDPTAGRIIIGAHVDAVKASSGADDNASGVSVLMESAKILSSFRFRKTIVFVGFDQEELGRLGSQYFAKNLGPDYGSIDAYINLDMIGFYSDAPGSQPFPPEMKTIFPVAYNEISKDGFRGNFILNTSNFHSESLMKKFDSCADVYVPSLKVVSISVPDNGKFAPHAFRSGDHVPFWDLGIRSIAIGDTGDVRNSNYHSPMDTLETLDYTFLTNVAQAVLATVVELASISSKSVKEIDLLSAGN
jgi:hypothetical protein